jgi:uncharacterized Zn-finger protein
MSDPLTTRPYTVWQVDCPYCGDVDETDEQPEGEQDCLSCGNEYIAEL